MTAGSEKDSRGVKGLQVSDQVLVIEKEPFITWLKLNRCPVMNCLNRPLLYALREACDKLTGDRETRVVAIVGAGLRSFCAGADLTERKSMTVAEAVDYISLIQGTMRAIEQLPQTVIAAINGSAFGGGTELALSCDLRVMVSSASLRLTEVKLGIIPGAGGTQRLPRLIGMSKAKELILTAAPLSAERGYELGLIHRVVTETAAEGSVFHEPLLREVRAWAAEIATAAPLSLKQAKYAIDQGFDQRSRMPALLLKQKLICNF